MTAAERSLRLDPELIADYLGLVEERGGPRAVERTALRTRSKVARDVLAHAASPHGLTADELISAIRTSGEPRTQAPPLDLEWTAALARVIGMQKLDASDLDDAVILVKELRRQFGRRAFTPSIQQTAVELLMQAGELRLLGSWLPNLRGIRPTVRRFLLTDMVNPFARGLDGRQGYIFRRVWQRRIERIFTEYHLEPVEVSGVTPTAFDNLSCTVDDRAVDGPLVSVIMPVFQPGPELITSVRSICNQTWRNLEILIMDDASPDAYRSVLDECAALDDRVQVHRMDQNGGTYLARNAALDIATGEFVTVQDADDWSHPRRIELQAEALLADPAAPATRSACLRVSEDLRFYRPGYEVIQENASSLMFRREQALATIGYFDRSRKSADTEFRKRLELATGALTTDLPEPLALVRMASGSLSRADFTPGWHHASRHIYRGAYERWHAELSRGGDPYLPRFQEARPFALPQRFQINQAVLAENPPHYDAVLLSDWRHLGSAQEALLREIETLTADGYVVGLAQRESYLHLTRRRLPLHPRILDLINAGTVDFVALDQVSSVSLLVVRSPDVLQFPPAEASTLDVEGVLVIADELPEDSAGRHRYTPSFCDAAVRATFSVDARWMPHDSATRSLLARDIPDDRLSPSNVTTLERGPVAATLAKVVGAPAPPRGVSVGEPAGTTAAAREAVPRPSYDAVDGSRPERVRIVLIAGESAESRLDDTLRALREQSGLFGLPTTVVYDPALCGGIEEEALRHPSVTFVSAADGSREELGATAAEVSSVSDTDYVSIVTLPRAREVAAWSRSLRTELDRLVGAGLQAPMPIVLWTRFGSQQAVAEYLVRALNTAEGQAGPFADYLAGLALRASSPRVEYLEPLDGEVTVAVWLAAKLSPNMPKPPWRYQVVLTRRRERIVASTPVSPTIRVDNRGNRVWENLNAQVSLQGVADGNYTFTLEVDSHVEALRVRRRLRPAKGVLLDARTVAMISGERSSGAVRFLVHATGDGSTTFITVQAGKGLAGRLRWTSTLIRKDLGALLRWRTGRRMAILRLVRLLTRPFFSGRRIWLVGERSDTAQDNGLHLFRHLRHAHPRRGVYYVIDPASPQRERVAHLGHVIDHSSWRHQLFMLHADVLANAYSIRYLTPVSWGQANYVQHLAWRIGALRIYLKHGVHLNADAVKRGLSGYDMLLTVMPGESAALRAVSGYDRQIREVGMPRYDGLVPAPPNRTVLFMPTWRQYLVPRLSGKPNPGQIPFEGSAYAQFISNFLSSPRLHEMLDRHDFRLTFLPHYNMASSFDETVRAADRISLADTNGTSFQDLLRTCDGFITDYSSVHFDVAYLGTPVIYARFDEAEYEAGHASRSWFDYEREGYGPVVRTVEETLDALEKMLERGCTVEKVYAERVARAFTYRDRNNSSRVVAAIDELVTERRRLLREA